MSFYNLVHGFNPLAAMVLAMLGTTHDRVPRFRDAWFDSERSALCIYTRTGGGNRDAYEDEATCRENFPDHFTGDSPRTGPWNSDLRALPGYQYDEDDEYDETYATFYYSVPPQFHWFQAWAADKSARPAAERWATAIDHIRKANKDDPLVQRLSAAMEPVITAIAKATGGGQ